MQISHLALKNKIGMDQKGRQAFLTKRLAIRMHYGDDVIRQLPRELFDRAQFINAMHGLYCFYVQNKKNNNSEINDTIRRVNVNEGITKRHL